MNQCRCKVINGKHATACPSVQVVLPDHNNITLLRAAWERYERGKKITWNISASE